MRITFDCEDIRQIWTDAPPCCPVCHEEENPSFWWFTEDLSDPLTVDGRAVSVTVRACCNVGTMLEKLQPTDRINVYRASIGLRLAVSASLNQEEGDKQ